MLVTSPDTAITDAAIRIARESGAIALKGFRSSGLTVAEKSDRHDVVTQFDRATEEHICQRILEAFPDSSIVAEEGGAVAGDGALTWYVDPIDGTSNFARGIAMWAVSIGVARDGAMIAGVVFDPVAGELFWADARGAFLSTRDGGSAPLRSAGATSPALATVAMNFPLARDLVHYPDLALEQFADVTREFAQVRFLGSTCVALCWIAAGWIDATVSFETNPWDVAAAGFIVQQAGGTFLGYRDGAAAAPHEGYLQPHYFASVAGAQFPSLRAIMETQSARPAPRRR